MADTLTRFDKQTVSNEIEIYLEESTVIRHGGCRESARSDIKSNIPPVIHERRRCEPDLADDLGEHMQRLIGVSPFCQRPTVLAMGL